MDGSKIITDILQNDRKQNTYKIALIRAVNDITSEYRLLNLNEEGIAIPLYLFGWHIIGHLWIAITQFGRLFIKMGISPI